MGQVKLDEIGYRQHYYGINRDSDKKQCFHCKYGKTVESNREEVICNKWNIKVNEDDICDYFEFAQFWAFDYLEEDRERRRVKLENVRKRSTEGCYIATAVYGSYDQPQVMILRKYRDEVLMRTEGGRFLVRIYYFFSPPLAGKLKENSKINRIVRCLLDKLVNRLERKMDKV